MTEPRSAKALLRTLGGLSIEVAGTRSALSGHRKPLGLLAMLAVAGDRGLSREKILAFLWPESDTEQARNSLSQIVFRVRRDLGPDAVVGNGELVLNSDVVSSDVAVLEAAATEGKSERVVELYTGPFLDGIYLRDAPEFERWVTDERERLHHVFIDALERLASTATRNGDHVSAVVWTKRRVVTEPLSARAARSHIEALVALGDRDAALRFGRDYAALVRAELEADPDPDISRLLDRVRAAEVRTVSTPGEPSSITTSLADAVGAVDLRQTTAAEPRVSRRFPLAIGIGASALLAAAVMFRVDGRAPSSDNMNIVVVAPFENATGDTSLNRVIRVAEAMLTDNLQRTGIVGVVDVRTAMARDTTGGSRGPQRLISAIAKSTDANVIVSGELFRSGTDSLELRSRIVDARSGHVLNVLNPVRLKADTPDGALGELSDRIGGALGALVDPRLASLREHGAPPPRFEAYREFVEGIEFFAGKRSARFDYLGSIPHFTQAAQLDTNWNLPIIWLKFAYGNLGQRGSMDSVVDVLASRRDRLSALDRHALDNFLAQRAGDAEGQYRAARIAAQLAPGSNWTYMHAAWASALRYDEEALAAYRQLDADGGWIQSWIYYRLAHAGALHQTGRFAAAIDVLRAGLRQSSDPNLFVALFRARGAQGDARAIDRLADSLALLPNAPWLKARLASAFASAASEASVHSHERAAQQIAVRCVDWVRAYPPDSAASAPPIERQAWLNALARCLFILKRWDDAAEPFSEVARGFGRSGAEAWMAAQATIRLVMLAKYRADSAAERRRLAEARALPMFHPDSMFGALLDAVIAAHANDARRTSTHLGRITPSLSTGRGFWHEYVEITPELRRSRELRALLESR